MDRYVLKLSGGVYRNIIVIPRKNQSGVCFWLQVY